VNRVQDYEERSKQIADECANEDALKAAREAIFGDLVDSVSYLKEVVKSPLQETKDRIKAAVEHCKMAGLYIERVEHTGQIKVSELELDL
jgi:hypothetical protein